MNETMAQTETLTLIGENLTAFKKAMKTAYYRIFLQKRSDYRQTTRNFIKNANRKSGIKQK